LRANLVMAQPKAPRFESLQPSSEKASKAKRGNKASNTKAEVMLRKALWRRGARYRLHVKRLVGKPDIVFPRQMVAIFIDGDTPLFSNQNGSV